MSAADEVKLESTTWTGGQLLATCRCSCGAMIAVQLVLGPSDESAQVSGDHLVGTPGHCRVPREDVDGVRARGLGAPHRRQQRHHAMPKV